MTLTILPGDDVPAAIWTHAEICLGIVSACLPCLKPLFRKPQSTAYSKDKGSSSATYISNGTKDRRQKTLGKESWMNGSRVTLVPHDQRGVTTGAVETKNFSEAGHSREDIELGLTPHNISVTRDFDVSRSWSRIQNSVFRTWQTRDRYFTLFMMSCNMVWKKRFYGGIFGILLPCFLSKFMYFWYFSAGYQINRSLVLY